MARDFNAADPDNLQITTNLGDPAAVTFAAWIDCDAKDTGGTYPIDLGGAMWVQVGSGTTNTFKGQYRDVTVGFPQINGSANRVGTGLFHGVYTNDPGGAGQELFEDGVSTATGSDTDAIDYGQSALTRIGQSSGGADGDFDGRIFEVGIWGRVLSDAEISALAKGYSPAFFPNGLLLYLPLVRDVYDALGGKAVTDNGTTFFDHPRGIIYPTVPIVGRAIGGADTAEKRYSMMNFGAVGTPITLFQADGAVDLDDRQHLLDCYSGIAFAAPPGGISLPVLSGAGIHSTIFGGQVVR